MVLVKPFCMNRPKQRFGIHARAQVHSPLGARESKTVVRPLTIVWIAVQRLCAALSIRTQEQHTYVEHDTLTVNMTHSYGSHDTH